MAHGLDSVNSFKFKSVIRGFHVYQKVLEPQLNEELHCLLEPVNEYDKKCSCIVRDDQIVGHIPQVNSKVCAFYIRRGGTIKCRVIGKRQHGLGLEIPCIYIFKGNEKDTNALISLLKS